MSKPESGNVENFKKGVSAIDLKLGDSFNKDELIESILNMKFGDLQKVIEGFRTVEQSVENVSTEVKKINPDVEDTESEDKDKKDKETAEDESAEEGGNPLIKASKAILKNEGVKTEGLKDNAVVSKAAQVINKKFGKNAWNVVKFYAKKKLIK
jgi:hypothetical protein